MHKIITFAVSVFLFSSLSAIVSAQTTETAVKPTTIGGNITAVSEKSLVIAAQSGSVETSLSDKTVYQRVSAETLNFAAAIPGALADITVGDQVIVSAIPDGDGKPMTARRVLYVTKVDTAAKIAKESEQWQKRGIKGRIASVDPQMNQIVVDMPAMAGTTSLNVKAKENAKFLRFAPDSNRFDEAVKSTIADVKAGDQINAIGDRSTDGTGFTAELILTGAFQTIVGAVKSIDAAKNEVVITNKLTGKDVTVAIAPTSIVKTFPRMAAAQSGSGLARPPRQGGQATPPATPDGQTPEGRPRMGGGGGRGPGGLDDMFERLPDITLAELKAGDMVAFVSTKGAMTDRFRAIKFVAGVEPFLKAAPGTGGAPRGQGVQGGFSIPGLDGAGF